MRNAASLWIRTFLHIVLRMLLVIIENIGNKINDWLFQAIMKVNLENKFKNNQVLIRTYT